ncbi:MAG: hypothetical protein ABT940_14170, partial [Alphaproteobacteria bacterium]
GPLACARTIARALNAPFPDRDESSSPRSGINPVERIWLFLRERFLSLQACCDAWNALAADAKRTVSLCCYSWIKKVVS